ncbi:hypothetical protein VC83_09293 [Pseudogymnoascus destructans]|uniref:Uncharacterized protein n=2 Tax=Pseudogymnoascus destructans TaxID=655981 RepID=L8FWS0_PSED2|nr:uncharacterized protein VC83_09293 [Pseudogymnoascus destructans]ELR05347.1 hypothetical protein GMDG_07330 [Pseudogymnoascus destructans 20631-21]OAF54425.1 hypothetical protein VC83_09293 [Pseudogymnoascus destructans]
MHTRNHTNHFHSHHLRQNNLLPPLNQKSTTPNIQTPATSQDQQKCTRPQTATHNFSASPSVPPPPCRPPCFLCRRTPPAPAEPATTLDKTILHGYYGYIHH